MSTIVAAGPVRESERLVLLDVLRGLAIFGILAVNVLHFGAPLRFPGYSGTETSAWDEAVEVLLAFFFVGKFYTLFSFLFGVGFALQLLRAEARGASFVAFYARRLLILLAFGVGHAVLLWDGDILWLYALLGFVLLAVRRLPPAALLGLASVCLAGAMAGLYLAAGFYAVEPVEALAHASAPQTFDNALTQAIAVYGSGSYLEILRYRLVTLPHSALLLVLEQAPGALAMFLIGLYVGRRRLLEHAGLLSGTSGKAIALLAIALVLNGAFVYGELAERRAFEAVGLALGGPALCIVYVLGVGRLLAGERGRAWLHPVVAVGRTALTNYLLQSLVCTTIFYGYGLALYTKVGSATAVLLAGAIYALQLAASAWWLKRFRFGPAEWLWRSLTYGRVQPLRRTAAPATTENVPASLS